MCRSATFVIERERRKEKQTMTNRLEKLLCAVLVTMFLLSYAAVFPVHAGTDGDVELINMADGTSDFIFTTDTAAYGDTFVVRANLYPPDGGEVSRLWGWQLKIQYDTSLLDCLGDALPTGHVFEGLSFNHPTAVVEEGAGTILCSASLMSGSVNVTEEKPLTDITFKITAVPTKTEPLLNCTLDFLSINGVGGTYLSNEDAAKYVEMNYFNAYYEFSWVAPTELPWLEVVDPVDGDNTITGRTINETLNMEIWIHDTAGAWEMIGVQFRLWYNSSMLWSLKGGVPTPDDASPDFTPGTFMDSFANDGEAAISMVTNDYHDTQAERPYCWTYYQCMAFILPDNGTYHAPFPDGDGLLFTIPIAPQLQELFPIVLTSVLEFSDILIIDQDGNPITQGTSVDGIFEMLPKVVGRSIDVYTQYPDPFGGQGLFQPSDMFWPQKHLLLCAEVTYNEWPEQNKDVAFQIMDPHGATWGIYYNRTNNVGVACVFVRLPWPCENPEYYLGEWTVIATVDVACEVVNDTLWFKYDYLVNVWDVESDKIEYKHCEYINATITLASYAIQTYLVTITMTVYDETGVPFGYIYAEIEIGRAQYCTYNEFELELSVHVIKFARAGTATIHVGALSDFPFYGGCALSPPFEATVSILAE